MAEAFEVLSAVLDGDTVDIGELETALEQPGGRRMFVDFVRLRQLAAAEAAPPRREMSDHVRRVVTPVEHPRQRGVPVPLAAAAMLLAALLGSLLSPTPVRQDPSPAPPEPARVLRFEPGVDWQP